MSVHNLPNWRWQRVVELVDDKAYPSRNDDKVTVRAWRFLKRKRASTVSRIPTLQKDYPDIFAANKMYEDENEFRWLLEAALCSDVDITEISNDYGLSVEEIVAYEQLFWDVRSNLHSPPYIEAYIVAPALRNRTATENSPDYLPKLIAMAMGYYAMLDSRKPGNESVELERFETIVYNNKVRELSLEASKIAPAGGFHQMEVVRLQGDVEKKAKDDQSTIKSASVDAVREILESLSFSRRALDAPTVLDKDGREPRLSAPE